MKLHQTILERIIELPEKDPHKLRFLLDDLGLEVKGIEETEGQTIYTIETLANRGDHLSALGVAREISARLLTPLKHPASVSELPSKGTSVAVRIETDKCTRYGLLEMSFPHDSALPSEVRQVMGNSSDKHPVVDSINYIALELGQPMHAFDRDKVDGEIVVVLSKAEEEIQALDGKSYKVPVGSILIRDRKKTIAVGGVIGCANSMVTAATSRILVESAAFEPVAVRLTARKMGISTDASYAFERGSDPEGVLYGLKRLAFLAAGARGSVSTSAGAHVIALSYLPGKTLEKRQISLNIKTVRTQMNLPRMSELEVMSRMKNLGYQVVRDEEELIVTVPSWRLWDVANQEDLIEDFVRSHGYNEVKLSLPPLSSEPPQDPPLEALRTHIEPVLIGNGFFEVITDSFYPSDQVKVLAKLDPKTEVCHIQITNALERDCANLKITNVMHLAQLAAHNLRKGVMSFKVFEFCRFFSQGQQSHTEIDPEYPFEREVLSFAVAGRWQEHEFRRGDSTEDLLSKLRGVIESFCDALGSAVHIVSGSHPFLHPGRQAEIKVGKESCGAIGAIHPQILSALDCKGDVLYAELDIATLLKQKRRDTVPLPSEFPTVKRDITLKIDLRRFAGEVEQIISNVAEKIPAAENLSRVSIIDDFRKTDESFRRVTYRLIFQSSERTLESAEVDMALEQILELLKTKQKLELAG